MTKVRVGIRVSVSIKVSLVLVIGWGLGIGLPDMESVELYAAFPTCSHSYVFNSTGA